MGISLPRAVTQRNGPGQILIIPRVMLAVVKALTVELVGVFNLKGIRRPMMTYNVVSAFGSKSGH